MTPTKAFFFLSTVAASKKILPVSCHTFTFKVSPGNTCPVNLISTDCTRSASLPSRFWTTLLTTVP